MKVTAPAAKNASLPFTDPLMKNVSPSDDRIVVTSKMFRNAMNIATNNFKAPLSAKTARESLDAVKDRLTSDRDILDLGGTVGNLLSGNNPELVSPGAAKVLKSFLNTIVKAAQKRLPAEPPAPPDIFGGVG